jgi:SAM-dependent methyltransferase
VNFPAGSRENWLESMMRWLDDFKLPQKESQWGEYYKNDGTYKLLSPESIHAPDSRVGVVQAILKKHRPQKVIDIGCNAGIFSCLAAYEGADVHAMDYDENALELFYQTLLDEKRSLPIVLSVRDITNWHPQHLFPIIGDMAFALAITHHLSLSQNLTFERIAWLLSQYTTGTLITDFMPRGLGVESIFPCPLPTFYTIENLINSLKPYFDSVRPIEFTNTVGHRIIIYCEGRNRRINVDL